MCDRCLFHILLLVDEMVLYKTNDIAAPSELWVHKMQSQYSCLQAASATPIKSYYHWSSAVDLPGVKAGACPASMKKTTWRTNGIAGLFTKKTY